jgi:hypothetical protein
MNGINNSVAVSMHLQNGAKKDWNL